MLARSYVAYVALLIGWFTAGCLGSSGAAPRSELVSQRDDIRLSEIRAAAWRVNTAYDLVRSLRPEMLIVRDPGAPHGEGVVERPRRSIEVYVDEVPHGGLETLAAIPVREVARVYRLTPVAAAAKYGGSHPGGVIAVTTVLRASAAESPRGVKAAPHLYEITREEIERGWQDRSAYEAVQALRPNMLRPRGRVARDPGTDGAIDARPPVAVYIDGTEFGGPEALATVRASVVKSIVWLPASDATIRYGTRHGGGVILVTTIAAQR